MQNAAQLYQNNQVTTATPGELTLMLYNGAIKFVKQAKQAIQENQLDKAHAYNIRAQDIVNELIITLNQDVPISKQLLSLYDYLLHRLITANLKKDTAILDEVEDMFVQFRDTWKQAMILAKTQG
jgi:flagellar protein FliS